MAHRHPASARRAHDAWLRSRPLYLETLEERRLLSVAPNAAGSGIPASEDHAVFISASSSVVGLTPTQIRTAYGINSLAANGAGQTIAIVDAYDDPGFVDSTASNFSSSDLAKFDAQFGLPDPPSFLKVNQNGSTSNLPATDPAGAGNHTWELEESLDVEWVHAIAPAANIVLVEANTNGGDLYTAVNTAAHMAGVSVVSMSWGANEFITESSEDPIFSSAPSGVTFVASTGDDGSPGEYPAYSPYVVAVGGTLLSLNGNNTYNTEVGWSGSGGGISQYESEPSYQSSVQSTGKRSTPDISFDASPSSGVAVYDSWDYGSTPWISVGGTSLAAPSWAAILGLTNQVRAGSSAGTMSGFSQTLPALYALPGSDLHDVTSGSNGGFSAGNGYDAVTGRGTPIVNQLVPDLAGHSASATQLVVTAEPASKITAGAGFKLVVQAENSFGLADPNFNGSVTVALANNSGGSTLGGTLTVTAVNGVATFSGLTLNHVGSGYTLQVTNSSLTSSTTSAFNVTATGVATHVAITSQPPASVTAGATFSLTASAEDDFGTVDTSQTGSIALALSSNPGGGTLGGTTTVNAVSGVAHFTGLTLTKSGTGYAIQAADSGLTAGTSNAFNVVAAATSQMVVLVPNPVSAGVAFTVTVTAEDRFGNVATSFKNNVTIALTTNPGGSTLSGTLTHAASSGVATFSSLTLNQPASGYAIRATSSGLSAAMSAAFAVIPGPTAQLVMTLEPPSTVTAGAEFSVVVTAEDSVGNVNTNDDSQIGVGIAFDPGDVTLGGTTEIPLVNGVAHFSDLTIDVSGTGYELVAVNNSSHIVLSNDFNVVAAAASQLVITTTPPASVAAGAVFGTEVTAEDQFGNIATSYNSTVALSLATNPSGAVLGGTVSTNAVAGVATFSNLFVDTAGNGYVLQALDQVLPIVTTDSFDVTPDAATQLAITAQPPTNTAAGATFGLVVAAEDQYGNVDPTFNANVAVALANNPGNGALAGTLTTNATSGVASFSGLSLTAAADGYTLSGTANGVTSTTSNGFDITPLIATQLVVTTPPPSSVNSGAGFNVVVTALDRYNNIATGFGSNVTLAIANNPATGTLGGTLVLPATGGVASFSNLTLDNTGVGYTLQATASSLPSVTTSAISVLNVAPVVSIVGPTSFLRGQTQTFTINVSDSPADMAAGFTVNINWGDGTPVQTLTGAQAVITVTHVFDTNATISVTATDQGGLTSAPATQAISVSAIQLLPDQANPTLTDLVWSGTSGADQVHFTQAGPSSITVTESMLNGAAVNNVTTFNGITGRVIGYGDDGNDTLDASGLQTTSATLDGGAGSNTILGGQAGDILIGGTNGGEGQPGGNVIIAGNGNNTIYGNAPVGAEGSTGGNNLIIGGTGNDKIYGTYGTVVNNQGQPSNGGEGGQNLIVGNGGSDTINASQQADGAEGGHGSILIAGKTSLSESALQSVLNEWKSSDTLATKIASISGTPSGLDLNGGYYLIPGTTVFDNGPIADTLYSDSAGKPNWLFYDDSLDTADRVKSTDITTDLD